MHLIKTLITLGLISFILGCSSNKTPEIKKQDTDSIERTQLEKERALRNLDKNL